MSLLLDDMRKEFAAFLAADPAARYRMDAALAHVVTIAYQRGMEDGKNCPPPPWQDVLDKFGAAIDVEEAAGRG